MSKMIDRADEDLTNPIAPWNLPDEEPEEYFVDVCFSVMALNPKDANDLVTDALIKAKVMELFLDKCDFFQIEKVEKI